MRHQQAAFRESDHQCEIGGDRVGRGCAAIGIDARGDVDSGDAGTGVVAQPTHFVGHGEQRFAHRALGADAEQAV